MTKSSHTNLLLRVQDILIGFYDTHGYPDQAISIFQEMLIVRRTDLGPSHEHDISILYILGSRCRSHARNHPYWIDYYQQIIVGLGKDGGICHGDAVEAYEIVSTYCWEDRRYAEPVSLFSVLWEASVVKHKEYNRFTDTKFIRTLFRRYVQWLEEIETELEVIHAVAIQYREISIKAYGASFGVTIEATLSLARTSQRTEKYQHQAVTLYEELSTTSSSLTTLTSVKDSLRIMSFKQISSKSSSSFDSASIERAVSIYQDRCAETKSRHGYSSLITLTSLRELSILLVKQKKIESVIKEMSVATLEIITKESSSTRPLESAVYIAETLQLLDQEPLCHELVRELHIQLIVRHVRKELKFSFDLTSCSHSSLVFLAGLEYHIRNDLRLSFSELMVDMISEASGTTIFDSQFPTKLPLTRLY